MTGLVLEVRDSKYVVLFEGKEQLVLTPYESELVGLERDGRQSADHYEKTAAEARVAELEAERDRLATEAEYARNAIRDWIKMYERENERVRAQTEQIAALRAGMFRLADYGGIVTPCGDRHCVECRAAEIAREALALAGGCAAPADEEEK